MSANDLTPGVVKLERVRVTCLACGQQVEAVAWDGRIKGFCSVARCFVDFLAGTQRSQDPDPVGKNPAAETSPVKDGVVSDYLRGVGTVVIQEKHRITPGKMYRVLHGAGVKLRRH